MRKEKRSSPRHSQKEFHQLIKELSDLKYALEVSSIVAITKETDEIVYVNDKYCEVTQYSRREIVGKNHRILNSGYHPPTFFKELWATILSGQVWRGSVRDRAKDGSLFWVDTTIVPLLNENKKPYQFICVRNEITKLKEMEEAVATLPQKIIQAQETERDRISREIHDDLGQSLATLKMMIQAHLHYTCKCVNRKELFRVVQYLDTIITKTRSLASGLRPSTLEVLGLSTAIKSLINDCKRAQEIKITSRLVPLEDIRFRGEAINLYRIIQEALANVITHARAKNVWLTMRKVRGQLIVSIKDDGRGFLFGQNGNVPMKRGLGLSTMQERTKLLQGQMDIDSQPGKGTVVRLEIPFT